MTKIKIHWWIDQYGVDSVHRNSGGSFSESVLGTVFQRDGKIYYEVRATGKEEGPFENRQKARKELELAVGGEPLSTWD